MTAQRRAVATVVAGLLAAAAGCGGDDGSAAGGQTTGDTADTTEAPSDPTTTTSLPPEEQVWSDLVAGLEVVSALAAEPDPDAPDLRRHFTGTSLESIRATMRDLQAGGGAESTVTAHRYSVAVAGDTATVDYCFVDTSQYLDTAGNPVGEPEVSSMRATAELRLEDGTWKSADQTLTLEECPT